MARATFGRLNSHDVPRNDTLVFAFDPGESTGWAVCTGDFTSYRAWGQGTASDVVAQFDDLVTSSSAFARPHFITVVEKFVVPNRPIGRSVNLTFPSEVIGALKFIVSSHQMKPPVMQLPVMRRIASKGKLAEWGWIKSESHLAGRDATSALQHLAAYFVGLGGVPRVPDVVR